MYTNTHEHRQPVALGAAAFGSQKRERERTDSGAAPNNRQT